MEALRFQLGRIFGPFSQWLGGAEALHCRMQARRVGIGRCFIRYPEERLLLAAFLSN